MKLEKVLVAIDGSDTALEALDIGIEISNTYNAVLIILCVASLDSFPDDLRGIAADKVAHADRQNPNWPSLARLPSWVASALEAIESQGTSYRVLDELVAQVLEKAQARSHEAGVKNVSPVADSGEPTPRIVSQATTLGVDLVIVGARHFGPNGIEPLSVANAVARELPCSCLVYRNPKAGNEPAATAG